MNNIDVHSIIQENKRRNEELDSFYDPLRGIGSPIERFPLWTDDSIFMLLPNSMKELPIIKDILKAGSMKEFLTDLNSYSDIAYRNLHAEISKIRFHHDFEYWAATCVKIKDKESGENVIFKLNRAQRRLLVRFEKMRLAGKPIRVILLKARQWGGSTLTQIYAAWIQNIHKGNVKWNSVIVADIEGQARNVRAMYKNMAKHYFNAYGTITFQPFEGSPKNIQIVENETVVSIGSMQKPESLRSDNIKVAHLSEVGSWKETESKVPEDLAQAIKSAILRLPLTMIVEESTAKGVGNFFHRNWQRAVKGKSGYDPVFIPWFDIELYRKFIENYEDFIRRMSEDDWYLWSLGATLEGINWYNDFLNSEENGDEWRMKSEFPSTAAEAFQSTGKRVFSPLYVQYARKTCKPPLYKGELFADSRKGEKALENIFFDNYNLGDLWIWDLPDKDEDIANRYCVFVDIGGRTKKADWSVIKVFDRYWMIDGGVPEVVAVWTGHLDQDLVAWKATQIAKFYNNALLAIETNSLKKEDSGGDHFLTVLDEIEPYYDNLYARIDPEKIKQDIPIRYGFHTNEKTKGMITDTLNAALRDGQYIERDLRACDEMDYYEVKKGGKLGAVEGQNDDHVIVTAGGTWLALKYMDLPYVVEKEYTSRQNKIISEATM